ncbi:MAG: PQQ-binding-like beta-propeller repeat protein [Planctomycetota bacterium]|nr:PQQ-binding-like beta-propeller repeat protein [Planctomycetota bacterium]
MPKRRSLAPVLFLLLCLAVSAACAAGDQAHWGQWPSRNMVSDELGLPDSFDPATGLNIKWSVKLGTQTYSTPIAARGKVFIGTNNDLPRDPEHKGDCGVLLCLDEKDGSLCWQLVVPKREGDPYLDWPRAGWSSPPTIEGDRVYSVTNRGEVVCLDINGQANGNDGPYLDEGKHMAFAGGQPQKVGPTDADVIWLFDLVSGAGIHTHDAVNASVLAAGPFLYVNSGNGVDNTHARIRCPNGPSLVVLDKATGKLLAQDGERIGPHIVHCSWSSPAMGEVNGRKLVFLGVGDGVCYAFEALQAAPPQGQVQTLKCVWRFDCDPNGPKENIHQYDMNRTESPSNITGMPVFHQGRVYVTAGGDVWHGKRQAWLKCIDASKTGDITGTGEVWSYELVRHCLSSVAIHDELLYITDCGRRIHCLDADTGRPFWTHDTRDAIWASPLVADGKVYVGTQGRDFWILAAGKEKKVLSSVNLDSAISGTATAANGVVYIATMRQLHALQKLPKR